MSPSRSKYCRVSNTSCRMASWHFFVCSCPAGAGASELRQIRYRYCSAERASEREKRRT
jgi:hypothetical protein